MLETDGPAALIALVRSLERDQPIGSSKQQTTQQHAADRPVGGSSRRGGSVRRTGGR